VSGDRREGQPPAGSFVLADFSCQLSFVHNGHGTVSTTVEKAWLLEGRGVLHRLMRHPQLFRWALRVDIVHVSVFIVRALTSETQLSRNVRSARTDAVVAAAGLSLAVVAQHRETRAPVSAGLFVNTAGCILTFMLLVRDETHARRASWWWTTYLLVGGNALSVAYLAASNHTRPTSKCR
jgi:hypothetical protein